MTVTRYYVIMHLLTKTATEKEKQAMTIFGAQLEKALELGFKFEITTSVWDRRKTTITSEKTQAYKLASSLIKEKKLECIVGLIGAKGRSQHSATDVHLFSANILDNDAIERLTNESNSVDFLILKSSDLD